MKTGLLITTFNRPEYLKQCLESVSKIELIEGNELLILVVDDYSTNQETKNLIKEFKVDSVKVLKLYMQKNKGIKESLRIGFNYLFSFGCQLAINLDGDAIVKPAFLKVLTDLKSRFPDSITSGFNTKTTDPKTGKVRHGVIANYDGYCLKQSIGGINMAINEEQYKRGVLPALKQPGHWDWNICKVVKCFVVSTPSVVQHIGIDHGMNLNNPDVAIDF